MVSTRADVSNAFKSGMRELLKLVGIAATHSTLGATPVVTQLNVGVRTIGSEDEALVNAYGLGAKLFTIAVGDLPTPPKKFETLTIDGKVYVIDSVLPLYVDNAVDRWRCVGRSNE